MTLTNWSKKYLTPILIILLVALALAVTGCEDFGFPPPETTTPEEKPEVQQAPPTAITTADRAMLAVYEHLLSQAESHQAKVYLADFYTTCDNWKAESELLTDGTSLWHVTVDMTHVTVWRAESHWQQASWLIIKKDGRVIPSNRFHANALRIEADLQELSLQAKPLIDEGTGEGSQE